MFFAHINQTSLGASETFVVPRPRSTGRSGSGGVRKVGPTLSSLDDEIHAIFAAISVNLDEN